MGKSLRDKLQRCGALGVEGWLLRSIAAGLGLVLALASWSVGLNAVTYWWYLGSIDSHGPWAIFWGCLSGSLWLVLGYVLLLSPWTLQALRAASWFIFSGLLRSSKGP